MEDLWDKVRGVFAGKDACVGGGLVPIKVYDVAGEEYEIAAIYTEENILCIDIKTK